MIKSFFNGEESDIKNLFTRFKKRNFTGDTGQAIKNSSYQLTTNVVMKIGSLLFTIIVARLLMPELFGLYSLALATIILFSSFSDLGIGSALITFVSKSLGKKNPGKAKGYFKTLLKWKIWLLVLSSTILIISSYFIANYYYNKPIFYALLVGALYIPFVGLISFFEGLFKSDNNFKTPMTKEIIFQISRLILLPLGVLLILKLNLRNSLAIAIVIAFVSFCYLLGLLYLATVSKKKLTFLNSKISETSKKEKKDLKKFIFPLTATALSGIFFGYIDTIMLGHFVSSSYIAYYGVALNLIGSASAIIGFTSIALFPIFSKLEGKNLESIFKKARNFTFLISIISALIAFFFAEFIIGVAYGSEYLSAVPLMKYFSILLLIFPLSGLYDSYFISRKKTNVIAWLLVSTTILNIILNWIFITNGLKIGIFEATLGACFATIISRGVYWIGQSIFRERV